MRSGIAMETPRRIVRHTTPVGQTGGGQAAERRQRW